MRRKSESSGMGFSPAHTPPMPAPVQARVRDAEVAIAEALLTPNGRQMVLEAMDRVLETKVSAIARPVRVPEGGWDFELLEHRGITPAGVKTYLSFCGSSAQAFLHYDPLRPEVDQRNHVLTLQELLSQRGTSPMLSQALPAIGLAGHDQLRALLCDGPLLLGWIGGFRERPFASADVLALQALVPRLRAWLLVERMLRDGGAGGRGLPVALDEIAAPVVLLDSQRRVVHANAVAHASLLEDAGGASASALRDPLGAGWHTVEMSLRGEPKHHVAICHATAALESKLQEAAAQWELSPRQLQIVRLLARGDSNKRIAEKLGIVEVTVETHITSLLKKSGAESRTDLAARVWSGAFRGLH